MQDWNERTYLLLGREAADTLATTHVMIVGVGGVGAYAAEMIARAGVGRITIVDGDVVSPSNINRQLPALHSTIGLDKVAVMQQRIADINPEAKGGYKHNLIDGRRRPPRPNSSAICRHFANTQRRAGASGAHTIAQRRFPQRAYSGVERRTCHRGIAHFHRWRIAVQAVELRNSELPALHIRLYARRPCNQ